MHINSEITNLDYADLLNVKLADGTIPCSLDLLFQPIFHVKTKSCTGIEILLNAQDASNKRLAIEPWLEQVEQNNKMALFNDWVFAKTLIYLNKFKDLLNIPFTLNISPKYLTADFAQHMIETLEAFKIPGSRLIIELTEKELPQDLNHLAQTIHMLGNHQIEVWLDDFGAGFANISNLAELPVSAIKLDKKFVQKAPIHMATYTILKMLVHLAHQINILLICEGVETKAQENLLSNLRVQEGQGFFFAKPMSFNQLCKFLSKKRIPGDEGELRKRELV